MSHSLLQSDVNNTHDQEVWVAMLCFILIYLNILNSTDKNTHQTILLYPITVAV